MVRTTLLVDASAMKDQLATIVTDGFDKAFKHMTSLNDKAFEHFSNVIGSASKNYKAVFADLSGLRAQIMVNVEILLPIIASGSKHGMGFTMGNRWAVAPDVHIITVGHEPKIKAYVLQGNSTSCDKLLDATPGIDTANALGNLLVLTEQMLEFHIDKIGNHTAEHGDVEKYPEEKRAVQEWDSNITTNSAVTFSFASGNNGGSNHSVRSDNSDDSAVGGLGHGGY